MRDTVSALARTVGNRLLERLPETRDRVRKKNRETDLVTEMDHRAEEMITERLSAEYPDHDFVAEEGTRKKEGATYRWLIDPLDGTSNYAHGFPWFAVSLALRRTASGEDGDPGDPGNRGETVLGVVYVPDRDELFTAIAGEGAHRNGEEIAVSDRSPLSEAMVATGFPYSKREEDGPPVFRDFVNFARRSRSIRRAGAAAIDLCYLACGIFDGFWEWELAPWDTAAGALVVREAGGRTSDFEGNAHDPFGDQVLATNGLLHDEMMEVLEG